VDISFHSQQGYVRGALAQWGIKRLG